MISILIPVFNRDVNELVKQLSNQLKCVNSSGEIILFDDGSDASFKELNKVLSTIPFVQYIQSATNHGRIHARQALAKLAKNEWLLFLDCDSKIVSDDFLKIYSEQINESDQVTVGGRLYTHHKPDDCSFMLHWQYGTYREVMRFHTRRHTNRFMTNNFLIRKKIFKKFDFTGGWNSYGYEDTWMGMQLQLMNVPVSYINNPLLHDGVETSEIFITKSKEALQNLKKLSKVIAPGILAKHVKLYDYYCRLRTVKLLWMVSLAYLFMKKSINKNLHSCKPSLFQFDLYRLYYFTKEMNRH